MTTASPFVVATTTLPFHLSWSVTGFVEVTRQSSLMEQELLTGSYGFLWGPGWSIFSVLRYVLCILVCFIIPSLFVIVLSVIILLTASAYSLAIFRIFRYAWMKISRFYQRSLSFLKFKGSTLAWLFPILELSLILTQIEGQIIWPYNRLQRNVWFLH